MVRLTDTDVAGGGTLLVRYSRVASQIKGPLYYAVCPACSAAFKDERTMQIHLDSFRDDEHRKARSRYTVSAAIVVNEEATSFKDRYLPEENRKAPAATPMVAAAEDTSCPVCWYVLYAFTSSSHGPALTVPTSTCHAHNNDHALATPTPNSTSMLPTLTPTPEPHAPPSPPYLLRTVRCLCVHVAYRSRRARHR